MISKNISKTIVMVLVLLSLSACATRSKYIKEQQSWVGKTIGEYILHFGYPNNSFSINEDIQAYVYTKQMYDPQAGRRGTAYQAMLLSQSRTGADFARMYALACTTWALVDKKTKIIKNITFRGNNCVSN